MPTSIGLAGGLGQAYAISSSTAESVGTASGVGRATGVSVYVSGATAPVVVQLTQYLALITAEFNQLQKYMDTVALSVQPSVDADNVAHELVGLFDLDTAIGQQEDFLGQWVGISRYITAPIDVWFSFNTRNLGFDQGKWSNPYETANQTIRLDDEHYRLLLRARIAANHWDGTIPGAYAVWNIIFQDTGYQILIQDGLARAERYFSFDDPYGILGFDRAIWFQKPPIISNYYFTLDDPLLGLDVGYWLGPPGSELQQLPPLTNGNMHIIQALMGPPLDPLTNALFSGGLLGLKSAGVGVDYVTQWQPDAPPATSNDSGIGLPLFAFDVGPDNSTMHWWMSYDEAVGLDNDPLYEPGAHPTDPNWIPTYWVLDGEDPSEGFDVAYWYVPGYGVPGFPYPPPTDPYGPLPPTGVPYPPNTLAGFDLGGWAEPVGWVYA